MIDLAITGWGALCSAGIGQKALASAVCCASQREFVSAREVSAMYDEALPSLTANVLTDFNARNILGRKGTTFLDRRTALTLVACREALEDSGILITDENRKRVGIVMGTTWGSLKSMSDYTRDTLIEERPYLVNPALFPNTVMNCAAGYAAIRYGLKGVNATVAGGRLAFLNVLSYSANTIRKSYADVLLAGAVEEFTPHYAWAIHLTEPEMPGISIGEAAAVFVLKRASVARSAADRVDAELLSLVTGFSPGIKSGHNLRNALANCIRRAIHEAKIKFSDIKLILTSEIPHADGTQIEIEASSTVLDNAQVEYVPITKTLGKCHAASGALQLAALLAVHRDDSSRDGQYSLITAWTPEGGIGAAVFKGWAHVSSDNG